MDVFVSVQNRAGDTPHTKVECSRQKTNGFNKKRQKEEAGERREPEGKIKVTSQNLGALNVHKHVLLTCFMGTFYRQTYKLYKNKLI